MKEDENTYFVLGKADIVFEVPKTFWKLIQAKTMKVLNAEESLQILEKKHNLCNFFLTGNLAAAHSQLLENSQLTLMEEWRGWCATFTLWAIIAHPTSPVIRTAHKS